MGTPAGQKRLDSCFHQNVSKPKPSTFDIENLNHFHKFNFNFSSFRFIYDDRNNLIVVETVDKRFYVATDQNASPLAYFDVNGNVVKQTRRTPFGKVIKDTNPEFFVPIGFHAGLMDPNTHLVYIDGRLYDPSVGQWMTPDWERLATQMELPTDVFTYRFRNNDPINGWRKQIHDQQSIDLMSSIDSWMKLFGYDVEKMQGTKYINQMVFKPRSRVESSRLAPQFEVVSGLKCIVDKVRNITGVSLKFGISLTLGRVGLTFEA